MESGSTPRDMSLQHHRRRTAQHVELGQRDAVWSSLEPLLRDIVARCGWSFVPECLQPERNEAPVATPSSSQVREPVHGRSIGEWQRYARQLEPLRQALVP